MGNGPNYSILALLVAGAVAGAVAWGAVQDAAASLWSLPDWYTSETETEDGGGGVPWWKKPSGSGGSEDSGAVEPPSEPPPEAGTDSWPEIGYGSDISPSVADALDSRVMRWEPTLKAVSERFDVPTDLLAAIVQKESSGDLDALGDGGDSFGLGQVQQGAEETVNDYFSTRLDRMDPVQNLFLMGGYLKYLKERHSQEFGPGLAAPLGWYFPVRAYVCGYQGANNDPECAADKADERLRLAGLTNQIPEANA